jgi:hypothetical protein
MTPYLIEPSSQFAPNTILVSEWVVAFGMPSHTLPFMIVLPFLLRSANSCLTAAMNRLADKAAGSGV